jgi:hypothetical protein
MRRLGPTLATLAALALLALPAAAGAAPRTVWLCKPGQSPDPCTTGLTMTVRPAVGPETVTQLHAARHAKVDCFYVYPTVSGQPGTNADRHVDPEEVAIARYQVSQFSRRCRVFAPMYRQVTLAGIAQPGNLGGAAQEKAYRDVRDAWRTYLRRYNRGRGVVLIGHSQGTFVLRELIRKEIDRRPRVRRHLVSALLLGGNVTVRRGSDRGGDFRHVGACRRAGQTGCVVAYSMFDAQPPNPSLFGRVSDPGLEVLCTNPAALDGVPGDRLDAAAPTIPFPGALGVAIASSTDPPQAPTPWVRYPGPSTARCEHRDGASWLQVDAVAGDPRPVFRSAIGPEWGLHLGDVNLALGTLVAVVRRQVRTYLVHRA